MRPRGHGPIDWVDSWHRHCRYPVAVMLRTMQELQTIFQQTINDFDGVERVKQEQRLSETYYALWKTKAVKEEGETNVRCLRFNFKSDFDNFCDKEMESIRVFCRESKLEILISWSHGLDNDRDEKKVSCINCIGCIYLFNYILFIGYIATLL